MRMKRTFTRFVLSHGSTPAIAGYFAGTDNSSSGVPFLAT